MNGIAIHVDGEQLDLGEAKVRLRIQSPLFQPEFIRQSYSYPFTLPWTPTNARLFRHGERMGKLENVVELDADIYLGGLFWRSGVLKFRRYKNGYDCDLLIPPDAVIATLGETSLQDLDLGLFDTYDEVVAEDFPALEALYTAQTQTINDVDFVFAPIKNAHPIGDHHWYHGDENEVFVPDPLPDGYVNHYDVTADEKWFYHTLTPVDDGVHFSLFTPCPYLRRVLEAVLGQVNQGIVSTLFNEDEFNRMVVVGNLMHLFGAVTTTGGGIVSAYLAYFTAEPAKTLPNITCIAFLVAIQKRFNGRFIFGTDTCRFVTIKEVLAGRDINDVTSLAVPDYDITIPEEAGYTLDEVEDPKDALGSDRNDALSHTINHTVDGYADLAGLTPDEGDVALVLSSSTSYQYNSTNLWRELMSYLPGIVSGDGGDTMDVGVAITRMYNGVDAIHGSRRWITPEVDMLMSDYDEDQAGIGTNDLQVVRLLFYRGMQQDSQSNDYPLLTNGVLDYAGDPIAGAEWCERIEGAGGIHELWYRQPLEVLENAKRVQRSVRLPLADIIMPNFTRKVAIDSIHYLVDAIDVEFTVDSMGIPRLDLVRV